ncbi:unnamed protein product [Brugia pahangi]|uniref:DDE Tnp4 domain-containing protein n=1 Tax=Brugia pahangi TaxID=6280 RepID=A0A0N4TWY6_BRUPA|nr:unnamed protein product [Brugia pahangi]
MHNIFILADSGYKRWNEEKRGATGNEQYVDDIGFKTKQCAKMHNCHCICFSFPLQLTTTIHLSFRSTENFLQLLKSLYE